MPKRYLGPVFGGKPLPLSYERLTRKSKVDDIPDTWEIEEIVGYRMRKGLQQFWTKWISFVKKKNQWLAVERFVVHYSSENVRHVQEKVLCDIPVLQRPIERDKIEAAQRGARTAESCVGVQCE